MIKKVYKCKQICSCYILFWNICVCFQPVIIIREWLSFSISLIL